MYNISKDKFLRKWEADEERLLSNTIRNKFEREMGGRAR